MDAEQQLSLATVVFATLSVISCACVCFSIWEEGYKPCKCTCTSTHKKKYMDKQSLNFIIFWMCTVDGSHMLPVIANWLPQIFGDQSWFWNNTQCTIIGVTAQFCGIQGPLWHILLAIYLGYLLCGGSMQKMYKQRYIHFTLINIIPLIGTLIPFLMNSNNGYHINDIHTDKDCWVIGYSQYIFISVVSISLIFHYSVLIIACTQWRTLYYPKTKRFMNQLSKFVFAYTIIRFFPLVERIYEIFQSDTPYWMVLLQHLSVAALGMGNALVWFCNNDDEQIEKNAKLAPINGFDTTTLSTNNGTTLLLNGYTPRDTITTLESTLTSSIDGQKKIIIIKNTSDFTAHSLQ
eukprot:113167_1